MQLLSVVMVFCRFLYQEKFHLQKSSFDVVCLPIGLISWLFDAGFDCHRVALHPAMKRLELCSHAGQHLKIIIVFYFTIRALLLHQVCRRLAVVSWTVGKHLLSHSKLSPCSRSTKLVWILRWQKNIQSFSNPSGLIFYIQYSLCTVCLFKRFFLFQHALFYYYFWMKS